MFIRHWESICWWGSRGFLFKVILEIKAHPCTAAKGLYRCSAGTLLHLFLGGASCHCHTAPCTLCVGPPVLEGQGCWHKERWLCASLTQPCAPLKGRVCSPSAQCAALLVGTAAALHLPVGTQITKSELPLYDLNNFLTTLTTSPFSCIFNADVEFYFLCILMRGMLIQK